MANKALVYAIYPNEKQNIQCQKTFGCCRFVYNHMLSLQQDRYKNSEKHLKRISQIFHISIWNQKENSCWS